MIDALLLPFLFVLVVLGLGCAGVVVVELLARGLEAVRVSLLPRLRGLLGRHSR